MKFTLEIELNTPQMSTPQNVGDKLIFLGRLFCYNQKLINNIKENGGTGAMLDNRNNVVGEWKFEK